jgi:hypothetical protein
MFDWYSRADICYAHLEDVHLEDFTSSRWFTRGWTLRELLAPSDVVFFGKGWDRLGTKSDLADQITQVTGIDWETLTYQGWLRKKSVAQRMSWASERETTRLEDEAYCLFGLFGVKMPLLYGEGRNAFIRLQEEILKLSVDQSLFAWSISPSTYGSGFGVFAPSPKSFQDSSGIILFQRAAEIAPSVMTNKGLQLELPIIRASGYMVGLLDCQSQDDTSTCIGISLATPSPLTCFNQKVSPIAPSTELRLVPDEPIQVQLAMETFKSTIVKNTLGEFAWCASMPYIFTGRHHFKFTPLSTPENTTFTPSGVFHGSFGVDDG